ncbi:CLUMA_CG021072, isoform A [Clunio marinus]|uniref:CLUMA_CG021072, isoform A n=1 Tax=Clunio marinus TaxID=568069 RepID=A0A1J1J675_9DIPT|nr:CLUMA_CG021072, isoform A [Clunio marinus]
MKYSSHNRNNFCCLSCSGCMLMAFEGEVKKLHFDGNKQNTLHFNHKADDIKQITRLTERRAMCFYSPASTVIVNDGMKHQTFGRNDKPSSVDFPQELDAEAIKKG